MIKYLLSILFITSTFAGVGDIAGGTDKFQKGSHIHFQRNSTWVNVLYSKSLCQTTYNYEATIRECARWEKDSGGSRKCVEYRKVSANQPKEGQRQRCKKREDDKCVQWITVDYIQSPKRIVEIKDEDGNVKERVRVIVPKCN
jgi:hypothetical protein